MTERKSLFPSPRHCVCGLEFVTVGDRQYPKVNPKCPVHSAEPPTMLHWFSGDPWGPCSACGHASHHPIHRTERTEDAWDLSSEPFHPLYIGLLPHNTRRMLQALDGYWLHCDGLPPGRHPRSRSTAEDWWGRFEKYRAKVEADL